MEAHHIGICWQQPDDDIVREDKEYLLHTDDNSWRRQHDAAADDGVYNCCNWDSHSAGVAER